MVFTTSYKSYASVEAEILQISVILLGANQITKNSYSKRILAKASKNQIFQQELESDKILKLNFTQQIFIKLIRYLVFSNQALLLIHITYCFPHK